MAIFIPALFSSDVRVFDVTFSAEKLNEIWFGSVSGVLIALLFYGVMQAFHKLRGKKLQRQLDPISFFVLLFLAILFADDISAWLFSN